MSRYDFVNINKMIGNEIRERDTMRENLRNARKAAGMTQQQVADYLGITVVAYKRIEYGQRIGKIKMWDRLEDLFKVHQRVLRENNQSETDF